MSNFKFELNRAGVSELLKSAEMQSILSGYAEAVAGRAGDGVEVEVKAGKRRAYANIRAVSFAARLRNNKNNTLLKALGGGQ